MLSTSTVCGGRKYFVDMTIKTFCRLIELFSPSPSTATRNQHHPHTAVKQKPALSWHCLWNEVLESAPTRGGGDFCPGCGWDSGGGLGSEVSPTKMWPELLSQRNQSCWDCLLVTTLLMVVWAKIISLLLLKGSAPLFWSPVLSIFLQPYPYFCLLIACGPHFVFRLWTHKWWNWLLAQVQDGDVGVVESHVLQIRHFLHPRQIPPWKQLLLTAAPTLQVVVDAESMVPSSMLTMWYLKREGEGERPD